MHVEDLNYKELLELDAEQGLIHFAGQRTVLIDAVAMGFLRHYLVQNCGLTAARAVLTKFGFAHGWRMAEALKKEFKWSTDEWNRASTRMLMLGGFVAAQLEIGEYTAMVTLSESYEAEQHLLHFGRSDSTICWSICGLLSGFRSFITGKEIYYFEDRCLAQNKSTCHFEGHTREEWGEKHADDMVFYDAKELTECLDVSLESVMKTLRAAEDKLRLYRQAQGNIPPDLHVPLGIVVRSPKMRQVIEFARNIAMVDVPVLITGESGVGKERIARLIHTESTRTDGPFIAVNCGAITETLIESEFFGYARGAFTGAHTDRPGLFEAANHGTLLLDEIGDISAVMQVKLLRVLQEKEVRRVGENKTRKVDVRILAATNRDLSKAIADGTFRQDFYYRLKVVELYVPPLRERREDILPLARTMLLDATTRMGRTIAGFTPAAADHLLRYDWPGNVRELENAIERAAALASGSRVELGDLPEEVRTAFPRPVVGSAEVESLSKIEKDYILAVLRKNDGNQTKTAQQLQIGPATLYRKLKEYNTL